MTSQKRKPTGDCLPTLLAFTAALARNANGPAMAMDHSHEFELTADGGFIAMQYETQDD